MTTDNSTIIAQFVQQYVTDTTSNAQAAYFDAFMAAQTKLAALQKALCAHHAAACSNPKNWGFAGELNDINHQLDQMTAFLNGDPRWDEK